VGKLENIVLVEMNPSLPSAGSQLFLPRHGALAVGSKLKESGYNVNFLYEPIFEEFDSKVILGYRPEVVAFTAITSAISRVEKVAKEISSEGIPIILGGEHASMFPNSIDFADYIILNEGEMPISKLMKALNNGSDLAEVPNLRYRSDGEYIDNPIIPPSHMPVDFNYDLSIIDTLTELNFIDKMMLRLPLQTSRGCPYTCDFCVTEDLLGKKYRRRGIKDVLTDIESGLGIGINRFMIVDNNFGIGYDNTKKLLESIISRDYGANYVALVGTDMTKNPEIVKLMKKAGINNVSVGIESVNDETLQEWNKPQKIEDVEEALKVFHYHGISVLGLFMVGSDHDTIDSVRQIPEFAERNKIDKIQISSRCITPFEKGLQYRIIPDMHFDFYNGHFVTIFPQQIRPSVLQKEIGKAYDDFYSPGNILKALSYSGRRLNAISGRLALLYAERLLVNRTVKKKHYEELLRHKEHGLYDQNRLDESKLT